MSSAGVKPRAFMAAIIAALSALLRGRSVEPVTVRRRRRISLKFTSPFAPPKTFAEPTTSPSLKIVRASNDTQVPPQLSKDLYTRLRTHGWQDKVQLVTIGGVIADPQTQAVMRRIEGERMRSEGAVVLADQPL